MWWTTLLACGAVETQPELEPVQLVRAEHAEEVELSRFRCGDRLAVVELGAHLRVSGEPVFAVDLEGCSEVLLVAAPHTPASQLLRVARALDARVWLQVDDPGIDGPPPIAGDALRADLSVPVGALDSTVATVRLDLSSARTAADVIEAVDAVRRAGVVCIDGHGSPADAAANQGPFGARRPLDARSTVAAIDLRMGPEVVAVGASWPRGDGVCRVGPSADERGAERVAAENEAVRREAVKDQVLSQSTLLLKLIGTTGSAGHVQDLWSDEGMGLGDIDAALLAVEGITTSSGRGVASGAGDAAGIGDLSGPRSTD